MIPLINLQSFFADLNAPNRIFISYNISDGEFVLRLVDRLEDRGFMPWAFEGGKQRAGDLFVENLDDALAEMEAFILVMTPKALASRWVRREYYVALCRMTEEGIPLYPVQLRDSRIPQLLRPCLRCDFRGDFESGFDELLRALENRPPRVGSRRLLLELSFQRDKAQSVMGVGRAVLSHRLGSSAVDEVIVELRDVNEQAAKLLSQRKFEDTDMARQGEALYTWIDTSGARRLLDYITRVAAMAQRDHLDMEVHLWIDRRLNLGLLPWELLHDGKRFLFLSRGVSLVRQRGQKRVRPHLSLDGKGRETRVIVTLGALTRNGDRDDLLRRLRWVASRMWSHGLDFDFSLVGKDLDPREMHRRLVIEDNESRPFTIWHHIGSLSAPGDSAVLELSVGGERARSRRSVPWPLINKALLSGQGMPLAILDQCDARCLGAGLMAISEVGSRKVLAFYGDSRLTSSKRREVWTCFYTTLMRTHGDLCSAVEALREILRDLNRPRPLECAPLLATGQAFQRSREEGS